MAGSTPIYGIPYPESSDLVANYPALGESLAEQVEDKLPTYSATAPTSPSVGQVWVDSAGPIGKVWDGSAWTIFSGAGAANFSDAATGTYSSGGFDYKYKTYTGSGTLTVTAAGFADILVIGGGGAGGKSGGGAGGAGGMLVKQGGYLSAGTHAVTVGAGGLATPLQGNNGESSSIAGYVGVGGGGGGAGGEFTGQNGGSGGSQAGATAGRVPGTGLVGQGFAGGVGYTNLSSVYVAGGGGGASAVGGTGTVSIGGAGANGLANSFTGTSVVYAGGGGGAGRNISGGAGGTGGGGAGGSVGSINGVSGTANTGGGAGGGYYLGDGGTGGSGVIIVRVKV
jgi:hypothetical protein